MTPPLDDGVERLQAFSSLLEKTAASLDTEAADVLRLAQALSASEQRLATELHALDAAVDGLQKEAESSAAGALGACQELGAAAEEATAEMLEVDQQADESGDAWAKALDQKGGLLEPAFQELQDQGFSPLSDVLESERRSFERWSTEAGAALSGLAQELDNVGDELSRDGGECASAGTALASAPCFDELFWSSVNGKALLLRSDAVPSFRTQQREVGQGLDQEYDELVKAVQHDAPEVRVAVAIKAGSLTGALELEEEELVRVAEATVAALDETRVEIETNAIQGEEGERRAAELVSLARKIEQGDEDLQEIRAATEATGS